eukprot:11163903-Lingulodinium_polyedra.AAC.1
MRANCQNSTPRPRSLRTVKGLTSCKSMASPLRVRQSVAEIGSHPTRRKDSVVAATGPRAAAHDSGLP